MISSPLRYPGGKGRMYQFVKNLIIENGFEELIYAEPFSGGFGIGIKLLTAGDIKRVIINDFDEHIYAFWVSVFKYSKRLIKLIEETPVDMENWNTQKEIYNTYKGKSLVKKGFAAFYLNRTNFSGVITGGPLGGIAQKSKYNLGCRMNKQQLIDQIKELAQYKDSVEIYNYDAIQFISKIVLPKQKKIFLNLDPPYVIKGSELYRNFYEYEDHIKLARFIKDNLKEAYWIVTYDDCDLIRELFSEFDLQEYTLTHMAGKSKVGKELLIKNFNIN
ncbi:MAG: DNA adenine methylase [Clostridiales bacterium]|nr:DNA adenine methylase [Clostridiales bacterium]